jgi:glycosyltransferase involved in cell wall biosynthesis
VTLDPADAPGTASAETATAATPASGEIASSGLPERFTLFAGRLSLEKGVKLLPAAAAAIAPVPLLVAGDGPLGGWLESQRVPNLRRLGHVDDATLAAARARAAAVIVPSLFYEHFGYTAAEALLAGRPVVAAAIGALPELVEHEKTGLLAEPGDGTSLGQQLRRALDDPAATRWAEAGRARVREIGDPQRHVEHLLAIYAEAAAGRA